MKLKRSHFRKKFGLRNKLTLYLLITGIIPVILALCFTLIGGTKALQTSIQTNIREIASSIASQADLILDASYDEIFQLAQSPLIFDFLNENLTHDVNFIESKQKTLKLESYFKKYIQITEGEIFAITLCDAKGKSIIFSGSKTISDFSLKDWWQPFVKSNKMKNYFSDVIINNQGFFIEIAIPIIETKTKVFNGALIAELDLKHLMKGILESPAVSRYKVTLIRSDGLSIKTQKGIKTVESKNPDIINEINKNKYSYGVFSFKKPGEGRQIVGFAPILSTVSEYSSIFRGKNWYIWYVLISRELDVAFQPTQLFLKLVFIFAMLFLIMILTTSRYWAKKLVEPIQLLNEGVRSISAGKLDVRLEIHSGDEVEELALAYNQMADIIKDFYGRLQKRIDEGTKLLELRTHELKISEEALKLTVHEFRLIFEVSQMISRSIDIEETLYQIVSLAPRIIDAESCFILLYDSVKGVLKGRAASPQYQEMISEQVFGLDEVFAAVFAFKEMKPILIDDADRSTNIHSRFSKYCGARAAVYLPLISKGNALGVLILQDKSSKRLYADRELQGAQIIANHSAISIENAMLYHNIQENAMELQAVHEMSKTLITTLDHNILLKKTLEILEGSLGYKHSALLIKDPEKNELYIIEARGYSKKIINGLRVKISYEGITGWVARNKKPYYSADTCADTKFKNGDIECRSEMAVPMVIGEELIGVLDVVSPKVDAFSERDLNILTMFAGQVAIALQNARLFEIKDEMVKQLREADRLKTEFLTNMSHELRTPLTSIIGFSEVLLDQLPGPVNENQAQCLDDILTSGKYLLQLINQILDLSKIESGKIETHPERFRLVQVTTLVKKTVKSLLEKKSQILETEFENLLPFLYADKEMIKQVFLNLISNAVKFTPEKGWIKITAKKVEEQEKYDILKKYHLQGLEPYQGDLIQISVSDNGIGIKKEDQEIIFHEFRQADGSYTREHEGTGLGLALAKKFVQMNHGVIWVESESGKGSTFSFVIPSAHEEKRSEPELEMIKQKIKNKILVIEDDHAVSKLLSHHLEKAGYHVLKARTGDEGVTMAREYKPFMITLDVMLPGKDGWQVLEELKGDVKTSKIPVIITSILENRDLAFSLGAFNYFTKPVDKDKLLNSVQTLSVRREIDILIIDDEYDLTNLLTEALEKEGFIVYPALSGQEGVDVIKAHKPGLIVLDIFMPEMNGFMVMEILNNHPETSKIPVILITGKELTIEDKQRLPDQVQSLIKKEVLTVKKLIEEIEKIFKLNKRDILNEYN